MKMWLTWCLRGMLILLVTVSAAWAQGTGQLSGTVRDESGGVLPGVTVTATQTNTGQVRTTVTDGTGGYLLTTLPTGPYRLEMALQGFKTYAQTGIVLQVGGTPTINAVLGVGTLEQAVTVEASAPIVDVRSAGISSVVTSEQIVELPLQGRQVTDLIVLAGGAVQTDVPARGMPGGVRISVGGGLPFGVGYTLDGASHNNPQTNSGLPLPFPDALQEFQVATSGLSAENGVKSGANVNAVTKSGANTFRGDAFEFLRDHHFNAPQHFAAIGPDGKQVDDGLRRSQFGGTLGGPIVRDRLFFFGGYQGTVRRQVPSGNVAYVPTAQMLAGDFTTITSPACAGRQVNLGAPFVGNRIDPARFSPAAVNLVKRLPATTDPCGQITYEIAHNQDERMPVARIDFQMTHNQLIFGRYLGNTVTAPAPWAGGSDNILKTSEAGTDDRFYSLVLGHTQVVSSSVVNALRVNYDTTKSRRGQDAEFFSPADVGVKMFSYPPANQFPLTVTDAFSINAGGATLRRGNHKAYGLADDVSWVKGSHQFGFGANTRYWKFNTLSTSRTGGSWTVDGSATGLALADLLVGRVSRLEIGGPNVLDIHNWYLGTYAQDSWRASSRVTINGGVRWEPYFGQSVDNNAIVIFNRANFDQNIRSKVFLNAPAGLIYPGDAGFPDGKTGLNVQWLNLAPRAGVAWDVRGDGRLAVRASYSLGYDFMAGEYHNINAGAPPFGNRSIITDPGGLMDDPWRDLGGDPHPIVTGPNVQYIPFGAFGTMDPGINSPRAQQWNLTLEKQLGRNWGVSASYLGSYADRLWAQTALNPGVFMGLDPCVINGVTYRVCSANSNLNQRRVLSLLDPAKSAQLGALDLNSDVGWQKYRGLKLSTQRRSANGLSLAGSYTLSRCFGTPTTNDFNQTSAGYTNPANPDQDAGYCDQDRRHLTTMNMSYETPQVGSGLVHAVASSWRVSGIFNGRSGRPLNITSGRDNAFNGIAAQRPDLVPGKDIYGSGKNASDLKPGQQIIDYFNRDAFAQPVAGAFGTAPRNVAVGPKFWQIDMAIAKLLPFGATRRMELRLETFNVFNHFNWGDPVTNLNSATFGRITTQAETPAATPAGDKGPRILQFGIKYDF
jgi:hypothetical protein